MPTNAECNENRKEIFQAIACRVKWHVFMLVIGAFGCLIGWGAPRMLQVSETANANQIRFVDYKDAQRRENNAIIAELKALSDKFDRLMKQLHERE